MNTFPLPWCHPDARTKPSAPRSPSWSGFALACLILMALGAVFAHAAAPDRPNIVFILADDLGINDLACYGRREHRTPHLDRLAAQGTRFTSAYCAQPICSPSRAAILTGRTPARLHLTTYLPGRPDCASQKLLHPVIRQELPLAEVTLAEHLKSAGYATACLGKWHLGGKDFLPTAQGFDVYRPGQAVTVPSETEGGKGEYELTAWAEEFISADRRQPFFLYLAHDTPHINFSARTHLVSKNGAAFNPVYAAVLETLDDTVGRLLALLDRLGLTDNTAVIFTSDNGGLHVPEGAHATITHNTPFRAGKGFLYEGGLRVPLIVRWPGRVPAGRVVDAPVINTDWLPTLLDLANLPVPRGLDGATVKALLTGKGRGSSRRFHWHFPHYTNQGSRPAGAVRDGNWKLIEHFEDGRAELFDLRNDPGETTDLAARAPRRVRQMRERLAQWRIEVGAQTNAPNPHFDPVPHHALYEEFDASRLNLAFDGSRSLQKAAAWRKRMNAVVTPAKPVSR